LTDVEKTDRSTVARLLYSLHQTRVLVWGTSSWHQAAAWLRHRVYAAKEPPVDGNSVVYAAPVTTLYDDGAKTMEDDEFGAISGGNYDLLAADFLADFLAVRGEMGSAAAWPVMRGKIERLALVLLLFCSANPDPEAGCCEVSQALDSLLK
jgi:hypothetical protein